MMTLNSAWRRWPAHILVLSGVMTSASALAQDLSVPSDPVAAIEGDWNGIWEDWAVTITNGRVVLTKGDPDTYNWLPVGTVLGVLNNNGKSEPRAYRFSGSTCLDHQRDQSPSQYKVIPCGNIGAVLSVFADSYQLTVSGISLRRAKNAGSSRKESANRPQTTASGDTVRAAPTAGPTAEERKRAHEAVEKRNRDAQAKYEADLAEQQRRVAEFKQAQDDVARRKAEQQAAAQDVIRQHGAKLAEHDQVLRQYQATQQRHASCLAGDKQSCADIAAGKPVVASSGGNETASVKTDANRCVSSPDLRRDDTSKGNTAAYVTNGCGEPVDVRICLFKQGAGWNCGVGWGIQPQAKWSYSSFEATGQVFVDARINGSGKTLASPN